MTKTQTDSARCTALVTAGTSWDAVVHSDGRCKRKGVQLVDGALYCAQHAKSRSAR